MQIVIRFITRVSELCCSGSSEEGSGEFMGDEDGSQADRVENFEGGGETRESVRMAEGSQQVESESGDASRERQKTMPNSVVMALVIARILDFAASQSRDIKISSKSAGKVPAIEAVDEESQSRSKKVTGGAKAKNRPQSRSVGLRSIPETGESSSSVGQIADSVRLVTSWFSPYAHRVAISLREKGVQYVVIEESVLNKNERTLNANPLNKRIPILMHRGKAISESRIIMEYIDEAWPESPSALLPKDPFERSAARYWSDYIDKKIAQIILQHISVNAKEVYETLNDALIGLNNAMSVISHGKSFFMGDRLGFVDIMFAPMIPWFQVLQKLDNYRIPDAEKCPRLHEWLNALQRHPSVRPSLEASSPKKLRPFVVQRFRQKKK